MRQIMAGNGMAEVKGLFNDFRMICRFVADNKKSCRKTIAAKQFKHITRKARVGAVVESQAKYFSLPGLITEGLAEKITADAYDAPDKNREQRTYQNTDDFSIFRK